MKKIGILVLFVFCCLFFVVYTVGCGSSNSSATTTTTAGSTSTTATTTSSTTTTTASGGGVEYFPHTDGYSWMYSRIDMDQVFARYTFDGTYEVGSVIAQIQKMENIVGSQIMTTSEALYKVTDSDVKFYQYVSNPYTPGIIWLDFPLTVGKTWTPIGTVEATVSTRESITVPYNTLECYQIIIHWSDGDANMWYAENIGLVKYSESGVTIELESINFD